MPICTDVRSASAAEVSSNICRSLVCGEVVFRGFDSLREGQGDVGHSARAREIAAGVAETEGSIDR